MHNIGVDVRNNIYRYFEEYEMPGEYREELPDIIKTTDRYYNSKYETGETDSLGFRKFFYNIVKPACDVATKFIDIDTKDIRLIPSKSGQEIKLWILQRQLDQYMEDQEFGKLLNEVSDSFPKYGHIVIKKTKKPSNVYIGNLRLDPTVCRMEDSDFVYEAIHMTEQEMLDMGWDKDEIELAKSRGDEKSFLVYETYTKTSDGWDRKFITDVWAKKDGKGIVRTPENSINQEGFMPAIVLHEDKVKELPYLEAKWEEVPGRWLGRGFVEYLKDNQIATNEAENLERRGLLFKTLQLWQTRDESIGGENALSQLVNGTILQVESEITPVQKDNADLSALNNTRNRWDQNTSTKTFSGDVTRGENLPSRTPLGVVQAQVAQISSYYDKKVEVFGMLIKKLIRDEVIPSFKKQSARYTTLTIQGTDDEIDFIDQAIVNEKIDKFRLDYAMSTGFFPSRVLIEDQKLKLQEKINRTKNRYLKIPAGFYDNAKFDIKIVVSGENIDLGQKSATMQFVMQLLPQAIQSPELMKALNKTAQLGGINLVELGINPNETGTPVQQNGSLAAPVGPGNPSPQAITQNL